MLPSLAHMPAAGGISTFISLRQFNSLNQPLLQNAPPRTFNTSSRSRSMLASASPVSETSAADTSFNQSLLSKAVRFQDLDACIYLLQNHGSDGSVRLSKNDFRSLVSSAFHHHRPDQAIDLVLALPKKEAKDFSILMKECLQRRDMGALEKVLQAREAAGFPPDAYSASARITALGAIGKSNEALVAFIKAWDNPNCKKVEVCNAAIGACAIKGDWAGAETCLEVLTSAGLYPDVVTYNTLIKAAGNARLMGKVKELFDEMLAARLSPTHLTYTGLFSAAAKNHCKDTRWLFKVFNDMALAPNDYVLCSFFSAAAEAPCSQAEIDQIFTTLAEARARGHLNDAVYTALLKLATRQGKANRAVDLWRAAQQDEVALSPHLFSALFAACAAGNSPALVDVALDAYDELRDWWQAQDKHRMAAWMERDVQWAYNSLLNFVGAEGRLDEALAVFEGMKRDGPLPDAVTFNTVIAAAGRAGDCRAAADLFREMTNAGIEPTDRTFGALLHAFATIGDATGASSVLQSLHDAEIEPNVVMYTSLIHALVNSGKPAAVESAFEVVEEMKNRNVKPNAVTYGCLLNACDKLGDVSRAFKVYQQGCDEGISPSDKMLDILINVCTRGGRLDDALELVKSMARRHARMQEHTLDSLVRALSGSSASRALRMLGLMQAKGMAASHATYVALVGACARESDGAEALALYKSLKSQGMDIDGMNGSALITCLCQSQDLKQAVAVYEDMMLSAWKRESVPEKNRAPQGMKRKGLTKRAQVPDASAVASLAQAFAAAGKLREAWRFYKQLRRMSAGMEEACITHRRMFEALIEQNCRSRSVQRALIVFDDWKAASAAWYAKKRDSVIVLDNNGTSTNGAAASEQALVAPALLEQSSPSAQAAGKRKLPKLSNVSLAFLEACCRSAPELEWRVYDVCSVMRMQKERKVQEGLARPQKASHHFLGSVQAV